MYSAYTVLGVHSESWHGRIESNDLTWRSMGDGRGEEKKERDERRSDKSSWETGT